MRVESFCRVTYKVVQTETVPPRKLNPSIPIRLESIILKCLAKTPDERFQTGEELALDLGELRTVSESPGLKNAGRHVPADGSDPNPTHLQNPPTSHTRPTTPPHTS